jgi:hypothetical protein
MIQSAMAAARSQHPVQQQATNEQPEPIVRYRGITAPSMRPTASTPTMLRRSLPVKVAGPLAASLTGPGFAVSRVLSGVLRKWNDRTFDGTEAAARVNLKTDFTGLGSELGLLSVNNSGIRPVTCTADGLVLFGMGDQSFISALVNADGSMTPGMELKLPWATRFAPIMVTRQKALVVGDSELILLSATPDAKIAQIGVALPFSGTSSGALVNRDEKVVLTAGDSVHSYRLTPGGVLEPAHSLPTDPAWTFDRPPFETDEGIIVASQVCANNAHLHRLCAFAVDQNGTLTSVGTCDLGPVDTLSRPNSDGRFVMTSGTTMAAFHVNTKGFVKTDTCTLQHALPFSPVITKRGMVAGFTEASAFTVKLKQDGTFGEQTYTPGWTQSRALLTQDDVLLCIRHITVAAHKIEPDGTTRIIDGYADGKFIKPAFVATPQGHVLATHNSCLTVIGGPKPGPQLPAPRP